MSVNKMLVIVIISALNYGLPREMIWNLCKENSLLLSDKYRHWKMSKEQKMLMHKKR